MYKRVKDVIHLSICTRENSIILFMISIFQHKCQTFQIGHHLFQYIL